MLKLLALVAVYIILTTEAAPYTPSRKADALFKIINRPTINMVRLMRKDRDLRTSFQRAMSVIVDFSLTPKERQMALKEVVGVYTEDVFKNIEMIIPLYESIRAMIIENFFPENPAAGAQFFGEALYLLINDAYLDSSPQDREFQLRSLISQYIQ